MKTLKMVISMVDFWLGLVGLGLVVWYMIDQSQNFTLAIMLFVGYVSFEIVNKIKLINRENGK
jgi:hypothetical protein